MSDAGARIIFAVYDYEFLSLFEKNDILLWSILRNEVFDASAGDREDVEPDHWSFVVVRVVTSITFRCWYDVLEPKYFTRLIIVPLNRTCALDFPGALASVWLEISQCAVNPPNDALRTVLALLEDLEVLLVVRIV